MTGIELGLYDTYATVEFADNYWLVHGYPQWWQDALDLEKTWALVEATNYLDATYGTRWKGTRTACPDAGQDRDWPRTGVEEFEGCGYVDPTTFPTSLQTACSYLAGVSIERRAGATAPPADLNPPQEDGGGELRMKRTRVGEIETEKEWLTGSGATGEVVYPKVDYYLRGLITSGAGDGQGLVIRA